MIRRFLLLFCCLFAVVPAVFADANVPPVVDISGTGPSTTISAGQEISLAFSGIIANEPKINDEAKITGPEWSWTATNGTCTPKDKKDIDWKFSFAQTGTYTVEITVTATYKIEGSTETLKNSDKATYELRVVNRDWQVDWPVGQISGNASDQNGLFDATPADFVVDENTRVAVTEATDRDRWTCDYDNDGQISADDTKENGAENDDVTYKWSAIDADGNAVGSFGSGDEREATWTPNKTGTFTLICTLDDKPKAKGPHDGGSRDDAKVERKKTVTVSEGGQSKAEWKLYSDSALTNEITTAKIGGFVYPILTLKLAAGESVNLPRGSLKITDLYKREDPLDTYAEIGVAGFEKSVDGTVWEPYPDHAGIGIVTTNESQDAPLYFRARFFPSSFWNTARATDRQPIIGGRNPGIFDSNGEHRLQYAYGARRDLPNGPAFSLPNSSNHYQNGPGIKTTDVQNLVVENVETSAGNSDYFCYDPGAEDDSDLARPTVKFTIKNEGDTSAKPGRYKWYLWARETHIETPSNFVVYEGSLNQPGPVEIPIKPQNGEPNYRTEEGTVSEWGTYAFHLTVTDTTTGSLYELRSNKISIPLRMTTVNNQIILDGEGKSIPGHQLNEEIEDDKYTLKASYMLKGERDASEMRVDLRDADLALKASISPGTERNKNYSSVSLYTPEDDEDSEIYKGIFVPTDRFGTEYRDHQNKTALAINQAKSGDIADNYQWLIGVAGTKKSSDKIADLIQSSVPTSRGFSTNHVSKRIAYKGMTHGRKSIPAIQIDSIHPHYKYDSNFKGEPGIRSDSRSETHLQPAAFLQRNLIKSKIVFVETHGWGSLSIPEEDLLDSGVLNPNPGMLFAGRFNTKGKHNTQTLFVSDVKTKAELVVYAGCWTARVNTYSHYGSLLDETIQSGAETSVGFASATTYGTKINPPFSNYFMINYSLTWTESFWKAVMGQEALAIDVSDALDKAAFEIYMKSNGEGYGGYDSWVINGNSSKKLKKARQ